MPQPPSLVTEVPPEHCARCESTDLRPNYGPCSERSDCRQMDRTYWCPSLHVTMAPWHVHEIADPARPRPNSA